MAYGATGDRNGLHLDGKRQHAVWLFDDEWDKLRQIAKANGCDVTGLIRQIIASSGENVTK